MMFGTILLFIFAIAFMSNCQGNNISNQRLCFDPKCSVPISKAWGMVEYVRGHEKTLSFRRGAIITVFSKSAGSRDDLWGVEVNGKRGYVPKSTLREFKIFHGDSDLKHIVPTTSDVSESKTEGSAVKSKDKEDEVKIGNSVVDVQRDSELYDVIDGTTILSDPLVIVTPTVSSFDTESKGMTEVPVESTVSFTATTSDNTPQNLLHSEMSPISATTMIGKPETAETSLETSETPSKPDGGNVVNSVTNFMSHIVSGRDEKNAEREISSNSQIIENEDITLDKTENSDGIDKPAVVSDEDILKDEFKVIENMKLKFVDEKSDVKEETNDEEEDDEDEDGEDDGDDEEDDDEEDDEVRSEDITHENSGKVLAGESHSSHLHEKIAEDLGDKVEEAKISEDLVNSEVASNTVGVSPKDSLDEAAQNNDYVSTASTETKINVVNVTGVNKANIREDAENLLGGLSVNQVNENQDNPSSFEAHDADNKTVSPVAQGSAVPKMSKDNEQIDRTSEFHFTDDPSTPGKILVSASDALENKANKKAKHSLGSLDKHVLLMHYNQEENLEERKLKENVLPEATESKSIENGLLKDKEGKTTSKEDMPFTSSPLLGSGEKTSFISGDLELELDNFASSPSSLSYASDEERTTASPISDDAYKKSDVRETDPSVAADEKSIYQGEPPLESLDFSKGENIQIIEEQKSNSYDKNGELEVTRKSDQDNDKVKDAQSVLPDILKPQEGFFSTLLSPLSLGYGFLSGMIFGQNGLGDNFIEGVKTLDADADKYGESESLQQEPLRNEDQTSVGGHTFFGSNSNSHCEADSTDSHCENMSAMLPSSDITDQNSGEDWMEVLSFSMGNTYSSLFDIHVPSYGALIYSIITGVVVLCFFLGHYFIEGKRNDAVLLAKINFLEKELTVSSKECLILKEKLTIAERKSSNFDDSTEVISSIKNELDKVQNEKAQLERELEATTEAGLEMELMVSQFLSSQHDSKSLMESIEQLQMQANQQQSKISTLENSLISKTQENENLAQELSLTEQKVQELEEDLKKAFANLNERDEEHCRLYDELKKMSDSQKKQYEEDLKNKIIEYEMALTRCKSLELSLTELRDTLNVKENEISVLQECLQKLKISNGEDPEKAAVQLKDILDVGKLKAELTGAVKERDALKEELQGEEDARKLLEDHVKVIREEVEKLRKCHEAAEREKVEAQTRLEVLSSYFKEKETQLQKELGIQEAMWLQKHTDASTVMQHLKSLEEEVEICRSQNETLKKEILDQERGYKTQIATFEKKAHENWVAARQAERKLDESKQEAGQLRNRLTMFDKNNPHTTSQNGDDSKPNMSMMDSNGELSASPLHLGLASNSSVDMLLSEPHSLFLDPNSSPPHSGGSSRLPPPPLLPPPPFPPLPPLPPRSPYHHPLSPPLPFIPPPPPNSALYPTSIDGHRPPPLGRMSSPPPRPSPSHSPHLPPSESRSREFPSPYRDRGGGGRSKSPPSGMYRGMPLDDRGLVDEWNVGRYCTPPPHSTEFPIPPYPRSHWEDEPPHPTPSFRPLPSQVDPLREHKGGLPKGSHSNESDMLDKSKRHGGKL